MDAGYGGFRMRVLVVAAAGLVGLPVLGAVAVPTAAAAAPKKPAIVSLVASPLQVPADGALVRLTVRVRNATSCTFRRETVALGAASCASGSASRMVSLDANTLQQAVVLHFAVQASGRGGKVSRTITVVQAAALAPLAVTTSSLADGTTGTAYSATLAAAGGKPPYTWSLTSGTLPTGLTLAAGGSLSGTPSSSGQFPVTVQVADAAGHTSTAQLSFAVKAPLVPVGPTETSRNWSGYALTGSGFTSATGTFTVPTVTAGGTTSTAEWIGVDGFSGNDLIQAGVAEDGQSGSVSTYAWWEILPAPSTSISTMTVNPGDTVTISIAQAAAGSWTISVKDVTNGQSFSTTQPYSGAGQSTEWIVEAATDAGTNRVLPLGQYSPPVTFTGLGWAGTPSGGFTPVVLSQRGTGTISVPSPFNADQTSFVVAYGGSTPAAPS